MNSASPDSTSPGAETPRRVALLRGVAFFALFMVLMQSTKPADLLLGALAAWLATRASLRLQDPANGRLMLGQLVLLVPHFLWQSVKAGIDVAGRALGPRVRVNPGLVHFTPILPSGLARNTFTTITSLLPGTVPCGEEDDKVVYHCLDIDQPVLVELAAEEHRLASIAIAGGSDG